MILAAAVIFLIGCGRFYALAREGGIGPLVGLVIFVLCTVVAITIVLIDLLVLLGAVHASDL